MIALFRNISAQGIDAQSTAVCYTGVRWFLLVSPTIDDTSKQLCMYLILIMNNKLFYRL